MFDKAYSRPKEKVNVVMTPTGPQIYNPEGSAEQMMSKRQFMEDLARQNVQQEQLAPKLSFTQEQLDYLSKDLERQRKGVSQSYESFQKPIYSNKFQSSGEGRTESPKARTEKNGQFRKAEELSMMEKGYFGPTNLEEGQLSSNLDQFRSMRKSGSNVSQEMLAMWWENLSPEEKKSVRGAMLEDLGKGILEQNKMGGY